jgi:hypothetical protein
MSKGLHIITQKPIAEALPEFDVDTLIPEVLNNSREYEELEPRMNKRSGGDLTIETGLFLDNHAYK